MDKKQAVLSIGIIFRDNIRSIERCLRALDPLREAVPCQLVMADTGSTDGSRAVAEKYADVLFDFPWIDDFSAARNAVIERSGGLWHLVVDTDEYLDPDISELKAFLSSRENGKWNCCQLLQRNYARYEQTSAFSDFPVIRMLRLDNGLRFVRKIHEHLDFPDKTPPRFLLLRRTILHHDGYVGLADERGKEKRRRNLTLLEDERRANPEDLTTWLQLIESSWSEPEQVEYVREAALLVERKKPDWAFVGPSIFRYAVRIAVEQNLPEAEEWIQRAERWFPNSPYTRIDVNFFALDYYRRKENTEECLLRGERYLRFCGEYRSGKIPMVQAGGLSQDSDRQINAVRIFLAGLYLFRAGQPERCVEMLPEIDFKNLNPDQIQQILLLFRGIRQRCGRDVGAHMLRFYTDVCEAGDGEQAYIRRAAFVREASAAFAPDAVKGENGRRSYTAFLPLAGRCGAGTAAAILESGDPAEMEALLRTVERWDELPIAALEHALSAGVRFPLPDKPLKLEDGNALINRMARGDGPLKEWVLRSAERSFDSLPELVWAGNAALAEVLVCRDFALCRAYAAIERRRLARYYGPELLREENIHLLPPMHRFGWYCGQAFAALEAGDRAGCVHCLREGLASCGDMKDVVEFLIERTPELQASSPSSELLALAEQVRTMLSAYDPADPAVQAVKASPVYQRVAHLIEGERA